MSDELLKYVIPVVASALAGVASWGSRQNTKRIEALEKQIADLQKENTELLRDLKKEREERKKETSEIIRLQVALTRAEGEIAILKLQLSPKLP